MQIGDPLPIIRLRFYRCRLAKPGPECLVVGQAQYGLGQLLPVAGFDQKGALLVGDQRSEGLDIRGDHGLARTHSLQNGDAEGGDGWKRDTVQLSPEGR